MNVAISMLGLKVSDRITGFEGVVCSISFDLFGCVMAVVKPPAKDGKLPESEWFDVKRLIAGDRVMDAPKFELELGDEPGGSEHPPFPRMPLP